MPFLPRWWQGGQGQAAYGESSAMSSAVTGGTYGTTTGAKSLTALASAAVTRLSDFNRDRFTDLVARDSTGRLWLYPGNGASGLRARRQIGYGPVAVSPRWQRCLREILTIIMFPKPEGYRLHLGKGNGALDAGTFVSVRWPGTAALAAPGNWDRAAGNDFMVQDGAGHVWLYPGNNAGSFGAPRQIGNGWGGMTAPVTRLSDFNRDGFTDLVARDGAGQLWLYPGNGCAGLGARRQIGNGWNHYYNITNAANLNGTGRPDLLARDPVGTLWLYPLSGNAVIGKRSHVIGNVTGLTLILGPGDVSGDRRADLVTRETSGRLRLYRGNGAGQVAAGTLAAGTWAAYDGMVAPGNWDHAGGNDLLGWDRAGRLWFNPGNNAGGFGPRRQIGYGWNTMHYIG